MKASWSVTLGFPDRGRTSGLTLRSKPARSPPTTASSGMAGRQARDLGLLAGGVASAAGLLAYAVRGRSSSLLAPSVYHGVRSRRSLALTFDDGPSESTPILLELLARFNVRATFFECGANV